MSNTAFYLKYRPQSLDQLVGQDNVKKNILGAFVQKRLSHAYLFAGPRGTGKTSTARILAKMVNCEGKEEVPCNKCSTCISITDGSNLDLIEIDAASNRGIEDIRSLREKIKLTPTASRKKVYIIDEVHMLTTEAFNALLKTLEEPPSHALFILATTAPQKLPETILSRVQRLDFTLASNRELLEALQKIAALEKIKVEDEALKLIVKKAEGSFRDGIKILDQLASTGEKITIEVLQRTFKSSDFEAILQLLKSFAQKNANSSLSLLVKYTEDGADAKEIIFSLMDNFRSLVFIKNGLGNQLVETNLKEGDYQSLVEISQSFTNPDLVKNLDILQKALEKMKTTSIPSLPLELAVVEMCEEESSSPVGVHSYQSSEKEKQIEKKLDVRDEKLEGEVGSLEMDHPISNLQPPHPSSNIQSPTSNDDILKLKEKWGLVLETVRPFNFSLEALLRSTNIKECTQSQIIMEVPYSFHQRILEAPKNRDLLESVLSDILGRSIQVATILGTRIQRNEDVVNIEVAADDEIIRVAAEIFNSDSIN